ncbi:hypothetical protein BVRB_1g012840 [Beta vulgaris subsp. vulgaris]|nr:hypothetical protein BVRB_1g012840 [Beta vulgaris subsp. vulgaris]
MSSVLSKPPKLKKPQNSVKPQRTAPPSAVFSSPETSAAPRSPVHLSLVCGVVVHIHCCLISLSSMSCDHRGWCRCCGCFAAAVLCVEFVGAPPYPKLRDPSLPLFNCSSLLTRA